MEQISINTVKSHIDAGVRAGCGRGDPGYLLGSRVGDGVGEIVKLLDGLLYSILIQVETAERVHNTRERAKTHTLTHYLMQGGMGGGLGLQEGNSDHEPHWLSMQHPPATAI